MIKTDYTLKNHIEEASKQIKQGRHTLLVTQDNQVLYEISAKSIQSAQLAHCGINFLLSGSRETVLNIVFSSIESFILNGLRITKKSTEKLIKSFSLFTPEVILSASGMRIRLHEPSGYSVEKSIECALLALDNLSRKLGKKVCVTLEEFHILFELKELENMASHIENILKKSNHIKYILFGSDKDKVIKAYDSMKSASLHKLTFKRLTKTELTNKVNKRLKSSKAKRIKETLIHLIFNNPCFSF